MFENPSRERIKDILTQYRTIAVVGLSDKPDRTSYMIAEAMQKRGYTIIPVNPLIDHVLGQKSYASLLDIDQPFDIVNVFRRSELTPEVAAEAVQTTAKVLWLQQGVYHEEAAAIAQQANLEVIMDRCIKVEDALLLP